MVCGVTTGLGTKNVSVHWNMGWLLNTCGSHTPWRYQLFWPSHLEGKTGTPSLHLLPQKLSSQTRIPTPRKTLTLDIPNLTLLTIWPGWSFIVKCCPVLYRMFQGTSGLYPQDSRSTYDSQVVTTINVCRHCQCPMEGKLSPGWHCLITSPHLLSSWPPNCGPRLSLVWERKFHFI